MLFLIKTKIAPVTKLLVNFLKSLLKPTECYYSGN